MKPIVAGFSPDDYNNYSKIQSLIDAHMTYTGKVSGHLYEWFKAGDVVSVWEGDVPDLLSKRLGTSACCGESRDGNHVFQVINN